MGRDGYTRRFVEECLEDWERVEALAETTFGWAEVEGDIIGAVKCLSRVSRALFGLRCLEHLGVEETRARTGWSAQQYQRAWIRLRDGVWEEIGRGREYFRLPGGRGPLPLGYVYSIDGKWPHR